MYAIVDGAGRQFRAEKGARLRLDRQATVPGGDIVFDRVLLVSDPGLPGGVKIGRPHVEGAKVRCRVVGEGKGRKVIVFRYKSKKGIRVKNGFRPRFTDIVVEEIVAP